MSYLRSKEASDLLGVLSNAMLTLFQQESPFSYCDFNGSMAWQALPEGTRTRLTAVIAKSDAQSQQSTLFTSMSSPIWQKVLKEVDTLFDVHRDAADMDTLYDCASYYHSNESAADRVFVQHVGDPTESEQNLTIYFAIKMANDVLLRQFVRNRLTGVLDEAVKLLGLPYTAAAVQKMLGWTPRRIGPPRIAASWKIQLESPAIANQDVMPCLQRAGDHALVTKGSVGHALLAYACELITLIIEHLLDDVTEETYFVETDARRRGHWLTNVGITKMIEPVFSKYLIDNLVNASAVNTGGWTGYIIHKQIT